MKPGDRYDLLCLLHQWVLERGTACHTIGDLAEDLAASITQDQFAFSRVGQADILRDAIEKLNVRP